MGSQESKPSNISNEDWLRYQDKKLETKQNLINQQKKEELENIKEIQDNISNFVVNFNNYLTKCHDVPKFMFTFQQTRENCEKARLEFLNTSMNLVTKKYQMNLDEESLKKIHEKFN
ncbi:Hypothetical protein KVN_LOCUS4 [uncultured virus]|nr:Hypothetical protein KVN_LOCUS4 [uncultured virus]